MVWSVVKIDYAITNRILRMFEVFNLFVVKRSVFQLFVSCFNHGITEVNINLSNEVIDFRKIVF